MITARTQVKTILIESKIGPDKISEDFLPELDKKVEQLVLKAAERAKENGRKTIMARDV